MNRLRKSSIVAAEWWCDVMFGRVPDQLMTERDGADLETEKVEAFINVLAAISATPKEKKDQRLRGPMRQALAVAIDAEIDRYGDCTIGVDYHPDPLLAGAAQEAGCKFTMTDWPFKTKMRISETICRVAKGYHQPFEQLDVQHALIGVYEPSKERT